MEGYLCAFCGKHFVYEEFFTEHIQEHHSPPTSSVKVGNNSTTDMLEQETEQTEEPVENENFNKVEPAHNVAVKDVHTTANKAKGKKRKLTLQNQTKDSEERQFQCSECEYSR